MKRLIIAIAGWLREANAGSRSRYGSYVEMDWQNTQPPKDRMIMRWHVIWQCAIPVFWANQKHIQESECPWISGTKNCTWPEDAFAPEWAECPQPPASNNEFKETKAP